MSLLAPLGFLGLIGLGLLILIYILKPNSQQKLVSSTFVWRLSLKYRRKKIPISKLRNILILICQILIIILCSFIMASPVHSIEQDVADEKVVIVDASASMLAQHNNVTRYKRAVDRAKEKVDEVLANDNGVVSVVLAGAESEVLIQRATPDMRFEVDAVFDDLLATDKDGVFERCTFGTGDINGAVSDAEEIVYDNDSAEVLLYTGTTYVEKSGITIVNIAEVGEWNAAILDCRAQLEDGFYVFEVDVASYGADRELTVSGIVHGANRKKEGEDYVAQDVVLTTKREMFVSDEVKTLSFITAEEFVQVYTFEDVSFSIEKSDDSFSYDNYFCLYNGNSDSRSIKVEYYSSRPNSFVPMTIGAIRGTYANRQDITITHIRNGEPIIDGFDLYIFEHTMPTDLPTDGVVILIDPDKVPRGLRGVALDTSAKVTGDFYLAPGDSHPLVNHLDWSTIYVSSYTRMRYDADSGFSTPLFCAGDPALAVKNTVNSKVVIMPYSLNDTAFPGIVHLSTLFRNVFQYFFPFTMTEDTDDMETILSSNNVYSVNESIRLRTRGAQLALTGGGLEQAFDINAGDYQTTNIQRSGTYTLTQEVISGTLITDTFFVQIPNAESYINKQADILVTRIDKETKVTVNIDLIIYFAAVMTLLLVAEWWLHSRELRV